MQHDFYLVIKSRMHVRNKYNLSDESGKDIILLGLSYTCIFLNLKIDNFYKNIENC